MQVFTYNYNNLKIESPVYLKVSKLLKKLNICLIKNEDL